jgi:hypothetical protein
MNLNLHADPDKIAKASLNMLSYAEFLESECRDIESALRALHSDWRDQQFKDFETHFLGMSMELKRLIATIRDTKPELDKDIRLLRDYQAANLRV